MVIPGSSFEQIVIGWSPHFYIPHFVEIGQLVPEKILNGLYHIWAWRPSQSCHEQTLTPPYPRSLQTLNSPYQRRLRIKFCFNSPSGFREDV